MKLQQQANYTQQQQQTQKLAMTQQLQQSIQILSYSAEELQSFIENKSLENPFIEVDNHYQEQYLMRHLSSFQKESDIQNYINQLPDETLSLYDSLIDQIHLNYRKGMLRTRMIQLVEYIDSNGYITVPLELLAKDEGTEVEWLDALTLLQQLEPAGIGARNLQECLLLQIERDDEAPNLAYIIIEEKFEDFANRQWEDIAKTYHISLAEIQHISDYILTLDPHPGAIFTQAKEMIIIPDLTMSNNQGVLTIKNNRQSIPSIRFASDYYEAMKNEENKEVVRFMANKKNEFSWIQRSVEQRMDTLLSVGEYIMNYQRDFFLEEHHPLKPLTLKEVAQALNIHESTVSRAVNGKYVETWFGIYELRSFFVKGIATENKEAVATKEIQMELKRIVNDEDKTKPLSDQKIADALNERGYKISRRTVAKYRKELMIESASRRKRFE